MVESLNASIVELAKIAVVLYVLYLSRNAILDILYGIITVGVGLLILTVVFSGLPVSYGYTVSALMEPTIISGNPQEIEIIRQALNDTDYEVRSHIRTIAVVDKIKCVSYSDIVAGCATSRGGNPIIKTPYISLPFFFSEIEVIPQSRYILSSPNSYICSSFEATLNHEIGHVAGHLNNDDSEAFANRYSEEHTKNEGLCN